MNTTVASVTVAAVLLAFHFPVAAQTDAGTQQSPKVSSTTTLPVPVRIDITKSLKWEHEAEKKEPDTAKGGKSGHHSTKSSTMVPKASAVRYDIHVSNNGVKALGDVKIKWSVLLHGDDVKDGEGTGKMGIGGALTVKNGTFPIEKESDADGCVVEVIAGGQVVATEEEPKGIKARIDVNRKSESKPTRKKKKSDDQPPSK